MYIGIITLLGLILRLIYSNQSFWLDEGASLMFAKLPIPQLVESIKTDFHPPIFYSLLHYWLPLAGRSEWLIRLPFIILATATIPVIFLLCREIFGTKSTIPVVSALFLALNPLHIYYSQELRMYSLVSLLIVLSWLFLVRKKIQMVAIINVLCLFTFYGAIFNIVAEVIYLLFNKSKNYFGHVIFISVPALVVFVLWWPVFSAQLSNGNYLKTFLPGWQALSGSLTLKSLILIPLKFILGRISFQPQTLYYLVGGSLVLIFFSIITNSFRNKKTKLFWIALITPLLFGSIISLKTPMLGYWRFLYVLPFFFVLLASGIEAMPRVIKFGTIIWVCGTFIFFNIFFWTNPKFHREDWRGLARFLSGKESQLVIAFPYKFAPLYFYETYTLVVPLLDANYHRIPVDQNFETSKPVYYLDYLADITDPNRTILKSLSGLKLKQTGVYNFNNLGQVYEFQPL
ncbi:MAG: Membrane protein-like protein [Candidatus Collierbacteria bacterium GW2011_GWB1_44_6]|uniref:Membrane protein-like protein n=2 Tax=Candidatus Collieribacteriota TaxID=1752725 RepID=A0A0G1JQP4_9BACT|nr:MAG: Membrane protein-like protein [Candidatus Collierbacteria bacterium GW2011_GWC2_43_12]KKT73740.1 MAG: Membrane protein-like protein [Candidatus Collierbacteria bacterium GW2011_GWB1_44_6]KKT83385.1 MAG: Membrane protein-like protein [Microgenomates group bacterium GW2011_GWC1_44_9]